MARKRKLTTRQKQALARGRAVLASKRKNKTLKRSVQTKRASVAKVAKRKTKRRTANKSNSMFKGVLSIITPIAYGAVRERVSVAIANSEVGKKLPVTEFTDEAVMLGVNWGSRKLGLGKNSFGNSILKAQKAVELARIGQTLSDVMQRRQNKSVSSAQNGLEIIQ